MRNKLIIVFFIFSIFFITPGAFTTEKEDVENVLNALKEIKDAGEKTTVEDVVKDKAKGYAEDKLKEFKEQMKDQMYKEALKDVVPVTGNPSLEKSTRKIIQGSLERGAKALIPGANLENVQEHFEELDDLSREVAVHVGNTMSDAAQQIRDMRTSPNNENGETNEGRVYQCDYCSWSSKDVFEYIAHVNKHEKELMEMAKNKEEMDEKEKELEEICNQRREVQLKLSAGESQALEELHDLETKENQALFEYTSAHQKYWDKAEHESKSTRQKAEKISSNSNYDSIRKNWEQRRKNTISDFQRDDNRYNKRQQAKYKRWVAQVEQKRRIYKQLNSKQYTQPSFTKPFSQRQLGNTSKPPEKIEQCPEFKCKCPPSRPDPLHPYRTNLISSCYYNGCFSNSCTQHKGHSGSHRFPRN